MIIKISSVIYANTFRRFNTFYVASSRDNGVTSNRVSCLTLVKRWTNTKTNTRSEHLLTFLILFRTNESAFICHILSEILNFRNRLTTDSQANTLEQSTNSYINWQETLSARKSGAKNITIKRESNTRI